MTTFVLEVPLPGESSVAVAARAFRDQAATSATAAGEAASAAADDAESTAADAIATAADRVAAAADAVATAADRVATGQDRTATGQDRVATGQDRTATAADRVQTGLDAATATAQAGIATNAASAAATSASAAAATVPLAGERLVGRRPGDTALWTMLRATPAWGFDASGQLVETAVDTLRWEFSPATLDPLGLAFAGARTNSYRTTRVIGGTTGVIGSGGAWPSNFNVRQRSGTAALDGAVTVTGLTFTYHGRTVIGEMEIIDLEVSGTPSQTCLLDFSQDAVTQTVITADGRLYAGSFFARRVSGTDPGSLISVVRYNSSGSTFSGTPWGTSAITPGTGSIASQRWTQTHAASTGARMGVHYTLSLTSGVAVSYRWQIAVSQLEEGAFASAPMIAPAATLATVTRAQGSVTIPTAQLGTRLARRQGIVIVDWNSQPGPFTSAEAGASFGLVSLGDGTADNRLGIVINPAHTSVEARVVVGGVAGTSSAATITAPARDLTTRAAVAWDLDAGFLQVAARGVAGSKVALTATPSFTQLMPGRYATSNPLFGRVAGLDVRPAALFDASLAALT
jgi:hypothetical protein